MRPARLLPSDTAMVSRRISDAVELAVIAQGDRFASETNIRHDSQIRWVYHREVQ
jgi:hypothetical protein